MFTKSIAIIYDYPDLLNIFSEALKMSGYDNVSSFTAVSFMLYAII